MTCRCGFPDMWDRYEDDLDRLAATRRELERTATRVHTLGILTSAEDAAQFLGYTL